MYHISIKERTKRKVSKVKWVVNEWLVNDDGDDDDDDW